MDERAFFVPNKPLPVGSTGVPMRYLACIALLCLSLLFVPAYASRVAGGPFAVTARSFADYSLVTIACQGTPRYSVYFFDATKLVLYLKGASCPLGSHKATVDSGTIREIRWAYHPEKKRVKVVVELAQSARFDAKAFAAQCVWQAPGRLRLLLPHDFQVGRCPRLGQALARNSTAQDAPQSPPPPSTAAAEAPDALEQAVRSSVPPVTRATSVSCGEPWFHVAYPLPEAVKARMRQVSWHQGCPVPLDALASVTVTHLSFDGTLRQGRLIVHHTLAQEVLEIFCELLQHGFPIEKIRPIALYAGDDQASMADNNSSAFNCRLMTGSSTRYSLHSMGIAIDINPLQNPYVRKNSVLPEAGRPYADRTHLRPGMISEGGACHEAFAKRGWDWGGKWKTLKDYQHFEKVLPKE